MTNAEWIELCATQIEKEGYANMGVTVSVDGEYTSSKDIVIPQSTLTTSTPSVSALEP